MYFIIKMMLLFYICHYILFYNTFIINNKIRKKIEPNKSLEVCVYNLQRMPYFGRTIKLSDELLEKDIICVQEYFNDLFFKRNKYLNSLNSHNILVPEKPKKRIIDSGLCILSKYDLQYVSFVPFSRAMSVDKMACKGFIISRIDDLFVINTHLQSCYKKDANKCDIMDYQQDEIWEYIENNKLHLSNLLLVGDFNRNIENIKWKIEPDKIIKTEMPTIWDDKDGIIPNTTPIQKCITQVPFWCDGGFLWSKKYSITNIRTEILDIYADHISVCFTLVKNE